MALDAILYADDRNSAHFYRAWKLFNFPSEEREKLVYQYNAHNGSPEVVRGEWQRVKTSPDRISVHDCGYAEYRKGFHAFLTFEQAAKSRIGPVSYQLLQKGNSFGFDPFKYIEQHHGIRVMPVVLYGVFALGMQFDVPILVAREMFVPMPGFAEELQQAPRPMGQWFRLNEQEKPSSERFIMDFESKHAPKWCRPILEAWVNYAGASE